MSGRAALCQGANGLFPVKETASQSSVWLRSGNLPWWQEPQASRGKSREVPGAAEWWRHVPPHPALKEDSFAKLLTDQKLATGTFQGKDIPKMEILGNILFLLLDKLQFGWKVEEG